MSAVLPRRGAYRDLLTDLLGRDVSVRDGVTQHVVPDECTYLAGYRHHDGEVALAVVADLSLAIALAGALGSMPPRETRVRVTRAGRLDEYLQECLHEVFNVTSRLHTAEHRPRVLLAELLALPGAVPGDLAALVRAPRARYDWHLKVEGYGHGLLTLLSPEPSEAVEERDDELAGGRS